MSFISRSVEAIANACHSCLPLTLEKFGRSGASYTLNDVLMLLPTDPEPPKVHAQDFAVQKLSDSIALLTYRDAHVNASGDLSAILIMAKSCSIF